MYIFEYRTGNMKKYQIQRGIHQPKDGSMVSFFSRKFILETARRKSKK